MSNFFFSFIIGMCLGFLAVDSAFCSNPLQVQNDRPILTSQSQMSVGNQNLILKRKRLNQKTPPHSPNKRPKKLLQDMSNTSSPEKPAFNKVCKNLQGTIDSLPFLLKLDRVQYWNEDTTLTPEDRVLGGELSSTDSSDTDFGWDSGEHSPERWNRVFMMINPDHTTAIDSAQALLEIKKEMCIENKVTEWVKKIQQQRGCDDSDIVYWGLSKEQIDVYRLIIGPLAVEDFFDNLKSYLTHEEYQHFMKINERQHKI